MKKGLVFTAIGLLTATTVFAGTLNIVSSFVSQKQWRKGLEYAGGYLYAASNSSDNTIHVYSTTGSLIRTIRSPASSMGVEVSHAGSGYIWVNTYSPFMVYRLTTAGSVVTSFSAPAAGYGIS